MEQPDAAALHDVHGLRTTDIKLLRWKDVSELQRGDGKIVLCQRLPDQRGAISVQPRPYSCGSARPVQCAIVSLDPYIIRSHSADQRLLAESYKQWRGASEPLADSAMVSSNENPSIYFGSVFHCLNLVNQNLVEPNSYCGFPNEIDVGGDFAACTKLGKIDDKMERRMIAAEIKNYVGNGGWS